MEVDGHGKGWQVRAGRAPREPLERARTVLKGNPAKPEEGDKEIKEGKKERRRD